MKKILLLSAAMLILINCAGQAQKSVDIVSLRGANDLGNISENFPQRKNIIEEGGIDTSFDSNPPMIPHKYEEDISLSKNSCLECHSKANAKKEDSPAVPKSHLISRDNQKLATSSARRYFCTQCHAPQQDKIPVVNNTYVNTAE